MILVMAGLKGGQGKTTLGTHLAAWLAQAGHRTLLVDLAPTGSASSLAGFTEGGPGSGEVLAGTAPARTAIRETAHEKLFVLPADTTLSHGEGERRVEDVEQRITGACRGFDFAVLDAPPSSGSVARAALRAADWALVPVIPDELGLAGLHATLDWMTQERRRSRQAGRLAGIVLNQVEARSLRGRAMETRLRREHPRDTFRTAVRCDRALREPAALARVLADRRPARSGEEDVHALRRELLRLIVKRT